MPMSSSLRLGTRSSALALAQAGLVTQALRNRGIALQIITIRSTGDLKPRESSLDLGIGVFVKELERALLSGRIDLAVHSAKDLPTAETDGISMAAVLPRGDARDALISRAGVGLAELPPGSWIGTDSPRRRAFILAARPDLRVTGMRGNVDTRLRKLQAGDVDAVVMAAVGLQRLGLSHRITETLSPEVMLPAVGQGALVVQVRADDPVLPLVAMLDDYPTRQELLAERAFLRSMGGGCRAPFAAFARCDGQQIELDGAAISPEGDRVMRERVSGASDHAISLGTQVAERLLARGATNLSVESKL
jgi:hydroxymethylbilane synthase